MNVMNTTFKRYGVIVWRARYDLTRRDVMASIISNPRRVQEHFTSAGPSHTSYSKHDLDHVSPRSGGNPLLHSGKEIQVTSTHF